MGKSKEGTTASTERAEGLRLDAIYDSPDPAVKRFLMRAMREEYERADERVMQRVAKEFAHLLPPVQQRIVQNLSLAM